MDKYVKGLVLVAIVGAGLVVVYDFSQQVRNAKESEVVNFSKTPEEIIETIENDISTTTQTTTDPVVIKEVVQDDKPGIVEGDKITVENVFNGVNQERYSAGMPILKRNKNLDIAAQAKLKDMIDAGYFAHKSPDGKTAETFIDATGYARTYSGENLAGPVVDEKGKVVGYFKNIDDLLKAWSESPTHKANIVKSGYKETGIAVSDEHHLVVQLFATHR